MFIRLFQASPRSFPALPDEALYLETLRTRAAVFFAVVTRDEKPEIAAQEIHSPATSLADIERRITELEAAQASITVQVAQFGGDYPALAQLRGEAEDALQMAAVRVGMSSATARIAYLQGFCPTTDVDRLRQAAPANGWGLVIDEPADDDVVPTLIRNPAWLKPIEAVFDLIGILPGYREIDVSLWFLLFFSLFFAMLVGDAGYGAIFLAATLWAQRKFREIPAHVFTLLKITSIATMVWGCLLYTSRCV